MPAITYQDFINSGRQGKLKWQNAWKNVENSRDQSKKIWDSRSRRKRRREKKQERKGKKRQKKRKTIEVRKVAEEWEIWDEEEEIAKLEEKAKKLVLECLYKWIQVFGKKQSERMPTRKLWDHTIEVKKEFVPRKGKVYLLLREERKEVHEFIKEQLRKGYIRPSKLPQIAQVFFVGKKDRKKRMV